MADLKITQELTYGPLTGAELIRIATTNSTSSTSASNYQISVGQWPAGHFVVSGNTGVGNTSSYYMTNPANTISAAGGISAGLNNGTLILSGATTANLSLYASSNTTGATSSQTVGGSLSVAGASGVSVGYSGGSLIISGGGGGGGGTSTISLSGVNTIPGDNLTTTVSNTLLLSAAGAASLGLTGGTLVISGGTVAAGSSTFSNIGNVTGGTTTAALSNSLTISGAGGASVGFSSSTLVISAPTSSQTSAGQYLTGNTAGQTSSVVSQPFPAASQTNVISAAGIVSIGFSTSTSSPGAGTTSTTTYEIVSGPSSGIEFATGNTTGATTSISNYPYTSNSLSQRLISGAGIASVGFSTTTSSTGAGTTSTITYTIVSASSTSVTSEARYASGANTFNQSSSAVGTMGSLAVMALGGISAGFSTAINSGVLLLSVVPPVASGTANSIQLGGNTFLQSSSAVGTLNSLSISAVGLLSAGFSTGANSGVIQLSVPATGTVQNEYAIGNTIGSSSASQILSSVSISGAGGVSVGLSSTALGANAIIISAATNQSQYALGNTTALSSSTTQSLTSVSVSAAGLISAGFSTTAAGAGALLLSAPLSAGQSVSGNTTGLTSSIADYPYGSAGSSQNWLSAAGAVSIGYSTSTSSPGVGTTNTLTYTIISGGTVAPAPASTSFYAIGNTLGNTSSMVSVSSLTVSGAGLVSVGMSTTAAGANSVLQISASYTSGTNNSIVLSGNTYLQSSSAVGTLGSLSVSAAGILSAGFSTGANSGILQLSAPGSSPLYVVGSDTTGQTSSVVFWPVLTQASSLNQFIGYGGISVGFSTLTTSTGAGTTSTATQYIFSAPITSLVTASSGIAISQVGSTVTLYEAASLSISGNSIAGDTTSTVFGGQSALSATGNIYAGITSSSIVLSVPVTNSIFLSGNTTGQTTSVSDFPFTTSTNNARYLVGAGIASVGFSTTTNPGPVTISNTIISVPVAASSFYAIGNTTLSSSNTLSNSLSISGAGIVSVGVSSSTITISGTSATARSYYAIGNTTNVSSTTQSITSLSASGAGLVSVGFSTTAAGAGALLISAPISAGQSIAGNTTGQTTSISNYPFMTGGASQNWLSGAGGVSIGYSTTTTAVGSTITYTIISGGAGGGAGGGITSLSAIGNTTGQAATGTTSSSLTLSAGGLLSAGFSTTGAGTSTLVLIAPVSNSQALSGNTTGLTSSISAYPYFSGGALSSNLFSGGGNVSVGYSTSTTSPGAGTTSTYTFTIISGSVQTLGISASNNTTISASSTFDARSITISAAGAISAGMSSSTIYISSPVVSSLVGSSGISVTSGGSSITLAESFGSYWEPIPWFNSTTTTQPLGTMFVAPMPMPRAISFDQVDFFSSRAFAAPSVSLSSSAASTTMTASATWASTATLAIYSQVNSTSYATLSSTSNVFALSVQASASNSSSSGTISETLTFRYPQGTSTSVTSSMSTTFSSISSTWASAGVNASTTAFTGWMRNDYPFAATLPPGNYLMGIMWSTASGTSSQNASLAIASPTWLATLGVITYPALTFGVPGGTLGNPIFGVGSVSSAASALPGAITASLLSSGGSYPRPYFFMLNG